MTPFLYRLAKVFYSEFGDELYQKTFVFPNRRAGVFFQKYLMEIAGKPIFSPNTLTIQELFASFSTKQEPDKVSLLVLLYRKFIEISGSKESFDDFLYWGEMLLNDFDDVDKQLADARQIFRNLHDLKSLEDDFSYLSSSQIDAIRRFWENFMPIENSETKKAFLQTWQVLFELYTSFRKALQQRGWAYEGMIFREVAERTKETATFSVPFSDIVFVGLNALTDSERTLLLYLKSLGVADFYWDYDSPLVQDEQNRASRWMTENLRLFPSKFSLRSIVEVGFAEMPQIDVIGIPSGVGQAKHIHNVLERWMEEGAISSKNLINTAVVLPDEHLLIPTLYSIPHTIDKINVTMGYGLSHAAIAGLIRDLARLQRNVRTKEGENVFYHRDVSAILHHPLVVLSAKDAATKMDEFIVENNMVVVPEKRMQDDALFRIIFKKIDNWKVIGKYLKTVLSSFYTCLTAEKQHEETLTETIRSMDLEREFIVQYYKTITRLEESLQDWNIEMNIDTYFRLLNRMLQHIHIAFSGEPLEGLQVMGVLETRVIDFENIILLSMNEGVFPLKKSLNSFIPYTLRNAFGLPTYEHQDSTYAYHFYRMIYRAKRVTMIYDTRTDGLQTGEVSRYFYQMNYLYHDYFKINQRLATYDVALAQNEPVHILKLSDVKRKMNRFLAGGDRALSASAINTYISCPLQFYFLYVEGLSEEKEVQESVEADIFGTIYHHVMEQIFSRFKNRTVTPDMLSAVAKNDTMLTDLLQKSFSKHQYKQAEKVITPEGYHSVILEILKKYVKQTLLADKGFAPFCYIDSEFRFSEKQIVSKTLRVNIKGSIDRIDRYDDVYRIIDYKTGDNDVPVRDMGHLFDGYKEKRPKEALQVFIYALMYAKHFPERKLEPAIYFLRKVFHNFNPVITFEKEDLLDFSKIAEEFERHLNDCLSDIFDDAIPFSQTENKKTCEYCPFAAICGR